MPVPSKPSTTSSTRGSSTATIRRESLLLLKPLDARISGVSHGGERQFQRDR